MPLKPRGKKALYCGRLAYYINGCASETTGKKALILILCRARSSWIGLGSDSVEQWEMELFRFLLCEVELAWCRWLVFLCFQLAEWDVIHRITKIG